MEKKVDVRKIVCLSICLVIFVIACVIGVDYSRIGLKTGNGKNARVSSLDDMSEMLSSFSESLSGFDYSHQSSSLKTKDKDDTSAQKYTSVTIHEQTSSYASVVQGDMFSTVTIQRSMDIGITASGTYYHVMVTVSSDSRVNDYNKETESNELKKHYSDTDIDMELYMSENRFLLRFNKFSSASDGKNSMGVERVLGRWGDFSDDSDVGRKVVSSLGSVNSKNFRVLKVMGNYIGKHDEDIFVKRGNVYGLESASSKTFAKELFRIVGSGSLAEQFDCGFDVDLSNDTTPLVTLMLDSDYSDWIKSGNGGATQYVSARVYEKDIFEFTNINNTVIDMPSSFSALTAEEFNEYMNEI